MFDLKRKIISFLSAAAISLLFVGAAHATNPPSTSTVTKMIIGDSIFALSGDIEKYLEADLGERIDSHARSGCQMIGGNIICTRRYAIPEQYANASKRGINTVIMNGGGNDFLFGNCNSVSTCMETLLAIEETIASLTARMKSDGIKKIVFLGYYNAPARPELAAVNEYAMDQKAATYPAMGITFVDTRAAFRGKESSYVTRDGIHPTAAGSRVLANLILGVL